MQELDTLTGIQELLFCDFPTPLCLLQRGPQLLNLSLQQVGSALHHGQLLLQVLLAPESVIQVDLGVLWDERSLRRLVLRATVTPASLGPPPEPVYLEDALGVPVVPQGLGSHAVGVVQLDFHFIEVSLHLLLDPQGIIPAPDLSIQRALHGLYHSNVVPLQLFNFLIFFGNFSINVGFDLVQLQLDAQDLSLFMFKRCLN